MIHFLQFESMVQENESLKEKVEELSLELEILRSEVSDGGIQKTYIKTFIKIRVLINIVYILEYVFTGVEGAATNAEIKTLTEQNTKLKEAVVRYSFILCTLYMDLVHCTVYYTHAIVNFCVYVEVSVSTVGQAEKLLDCGWNRTYYCLYPH